MTEFTIRYHKFDDNELGECEIEVPNDEANELIMHFKTPFGIELSKGQIIKYKEVTHIIFKASKRKLQALEKTIAIASQAIARLN